METNSNKIVVKKTRCVCGSVHTSRMHHRDFPELWVECATPLESALHLLNELSRALDSAASNRRRERVLQAMQEAKVFLETQRVADGARRGTAGRHSPAHS